MHNQERWDFIKELGEDHDQRTRADRFAELRHWLVDGSGGDRSAAASALCELGGADALALIRERYEGETNRFVLSGMDAAIRVLARR